MDDSLDGMMLIRSPDAGGFVRSNPMFHEAVGFEDVELAEKPLTQWLIPEDRAALQAALDAGEGTCCVEHLTTSSGTVPLVLQVRREGARTMVLARAPASSTSSGTTPGETQHGTVRDTLETIAHIVEEQNPGYRCSILLVRDGRFVSGAGPSLPVEYNAAIDGYAVGPAVGSCGTAIYWTVPVIVEDIQADPLWVEFAPLAATAGVAACWSHPFTSSNGRVLGALALYAPEPRTPTLEQLGRLRAAARMTGLAVERGRAEEALRTQRERELELQEQLRRAAKLEALGVLAGGVAHDFNNVLFTILANAEFALDLIPDDSEGIEFLQEIIVASQRAGGFCRQMLAYAGRGSYQPQLLDLRNLVPQVDGLVHAALSKKVTLRVEQPDTPALIDGDENQLLQVLLNLVTNAADAIGNREGTIVVSTTARSYDESALTRFVPATDLAPGEFWELTVSDTGCGMDEATAARIFDPFYTTKDSGRGLGLAATQGIIARHRAAIALDSVVGEGTTFTVLFPVSVDKPLLAPETPTAREVAVPKRILVADDEDGLRSILCRRLRRNGFDVVEAADGQQALERFEETPGSFDCILLDLSMPKLSGDEVFQAMRATRPDLPVLLMSGYAAQEVLDRFGPGSVDGVLQKPVSGRDLMTAITRATT